MRAQLLPRTWPTQLIRTYDVDGRPSARLSTSYLKVARGAPGQWSYALRSTERFEGWRFDDAQALAAAERWRRVMPGQEHLGDRRARYARAWPSIDVDRRAPGLVRLDDREQTMEITDAQWEALLADLRALGAGRQWSRLPSTPPTPLTPADARVRRVGRERVYEQALANPITLSKGAGFWRVVAGGDTLRINVEDLAQARERLGQLSPGVFSPGVEHSGRRGDWRQWSLCWHRPDHGWPDGSVEAWNPHGLGIHDQSRFGEQQWRTLVRDLGLLEEGTSLGRLPSTVAGPSLRMHAGSGRADSLAGVLAPRGR